MKHTLPTININGKQYFIYFCYGSNLNQEQMAHRCPDAIPLETAELPSYKLLFRGNSRGFGVATVEQDGYSAVPGALWAISRSDLETLDRYEGYPTLYTRGNVEVKTEDGQTVTAMTYWMHSYRYQKAMPSRQYLQTIYNGYRHFGINTEWLRFFYDKHINDMYNEEEMA